ncbi:hypothetical protein D3C80_2032220 [compost metagenome]
MPEAAMDEDNGTVPGEHDIGRAWQRLPMQPEAQPERMKKLSDHDLWLSMRTFYRAHNFTTG